MDIYPNPESQPEAEPGPQPQPDPSRQLGAQPGAQVGPEVGPDPTEGQASHQAWTPPTWPPAPASAPSWSPPGGDPPPSPPWAAGGYGPYGPYGHYGPPAPPPQQRPHGPWSVVAVAAAVFVASVFGFGLASRLHGGSTNGTAATSGVTGSDASTAAGPATTSQAAAVAAKVDPGIVDINTVLGFRNGAAAGTGMVLTSTGEVLTNNHVVAGATVIRATVVTTGRTYTATVVGTDPADDVAVIQLRGASGLKTVSTGDSSRVGVGTSVVAIGNALGAGGTPSAVDGRITGLNRTITAGDASGGGQEQLAGLIQTDAALQPGDSGGPLVTADGKVIGMDTAASSNYRFQAASGVSFAIPINTALSIAKQMEAGTAVNGGTIGATGFLGVQVDSTQTGGAVIAGVQPNTPAEAAGLAAGDTITSVNGRTVDSASALTSILRTYKPRAKVTLGWTDASGQAHSTTVTLGTAPAA